MKKAASDIRILKRANMTEDEKITASNRDKKNETS